MSYNTFPTLPGIGWPVKVTPTFKTIVQQAASGAEFRTGLWQNPLHTIEVPINYLSQTDWRTLVDFFKQQQGSFLPFYLTPQQAPWAASQIPFGTWNGTATSAGLVDSRGNPISSATVSAIHRTDWQGRQLLYPTARTNEALYSQNFSIGWTYFTDTLTPNAGTAPDGTTTLNEFTISTATSGNYHVNIRNIPCTSGATQAARVYLKPGSAPHCFAALGDNTTGYVFVIINQSGVVTGSGAQGSWTNFSYTIAPGPNGTFEIGLQGDIASSAAVLTTGFSNSATGPSYNYVGNGTDTYSAWGWMYDQTTLAQLGAYIPTTSYAPVPLTDYTIAGTTVNLAQAPGATATTDWDGIGSNVETYLVRFPDGIEFEQFMSQLYRTKTLKLQEVR
jgi:hypothetical protein